MTKYRNVLEAIGKTPLIRLNRIAMGLPIELYGKLEAVNPGGSIKDRIGVAMIEAAEKNGKLRPGGTIVEATAGNTGVGIALAAAVKGYRCIFAIPSKMSEEKVNLLKALGAEVVITPTDVPPDHPSSYNGVADRLASEIKDAFRPSQFSNEANPGAHYDTTGPEIWKDTNGKIDVLVAGAGTGGTISGIGSYLKKQNPDIKVVLADPEGSILSGDSPRTYLVEGIGEDFIPYNYNRQVVDTSIRVSDKESFAMAKRLACEEGLIVGSSSGTAVAAALRYAERLKGGESIVAVLPDTGRNYLSKLYNEDWLKEHNFISNQATRLTAGEATQRKSSQGIVSVSPTASIAEAVEIMHRYNISQLPVMKDDHVVGSVDETSIMLIARHESHLDQTVETIMGKPFPTVFESTDIHEVYRLLMGAHHAVIVENQEGAIAILTRLDLIDFWRSRSPKI